MAGMEYSRSNFPTGAVPNLCGELFIIPSYLLLSECKGKKYLYSYTVFISFAALNKYNKIMSEFPVAALFDLDGVIVDTEPQYSMFWDKAGEKYLHDSDRFGSKIKGNTLRQIFDRHFAGHDDWQQEIAAALQEWERNMRFDLIPGVLDFLKALRACGIRMAIVTSSDSEKMKSLRRAHPELMAYFDTVVTADDIVRSKPDPEGYLLAARRLGAAPHEAVVFEDSRAGLQAGRAGGMRVVGLATTLPAGEVAALADKVIADFSGLLPDRIFAKE